MKILDDIKKKLGITFDSDKFPNVILGTCIGDALGVPFETMRSGNPILKSWNGKSFSASKFHKTSAGDFSDDGQMSIMVAESLIKNKHYNPKDMAERYVDWIYSGRARGYGRTTKIAIDNLKNGADFSKSGVEGSFGNGTAMRAAPFGVFYAKRHFNDMFHAVKIDSAITHRSVEAEAGALTVAITTYLTVRGESDKVPSFLAVHLPDSEVKRKVLKAHDLATSKLRRTITVPVALNMLGTGADVRQTVPAAMYCYWAFNDYASAVRAAIRGGRDTDTTAAIVGGMFGAKTKLGGIPAPWVRAVEESSRLRELDVMLAAP